MTLTRSCKAIVSLSGVMNVLWTRNLSLHFEFSGGSSLRGWSITEDNKKELSMIDGAATTLLPETSTLSPGSTRPEFGRTQYNCTQCTQEKYTQTMIAVSVTFGAVVLTLKATGSEFWFVIVRERLTTWVRGPGTKMRGRVENNKKNIRLKPRLRLGARRTDIWLEKRDWEEICRGVLATWSSPPWELKATLLSEGIVTRAIVEFSPICIPQLPVLPCWSCVCSDTITKSRSYIERNYYLIFPDIIQSSLLKACSVIVASFW